MTSTPRRPSFFLASLALLACGAPAVQPDGGPADASTSSADGGTTCAPGTWDKDGNPRTACVAWTACAPGSYVVREGTASRDRQCAACPSGTFASQTNQASCAAFRSCEAGTFIAEAGTKSSDRLCATCATGTSSELADSPSCEEWKVCAPGTFAASEPSAAANRVCTACPSGSYSASTNASECTAMTTCQPGTRVASGGTATTDRTCAACVRGTFAASTNAAQCAPWSDCQPGTRVAAAGTSTTDRTCEACPAGQYSSEKNASACRSAEGACPPGTRQTAPATSTSPAQCAACQAGTYCAGGSTAQVSCGSGTWDADGSAATACVAWVDCPAGQYVKTPGTAVANRVCAACANGDTTSTVNASSCSPGAWLLSYFGPAQSLSSDALHLAYSRDGQKWVNLNYHRPVYQPPAEAQFGSRHIRDPFILRKNDGTFVYLATDWTLAENDGTYWSSPSSKLFVADSTDLITFTNPRLLTVTTLKGPNDSNGQATAMHAWAPEAYYDAKRDAYAILWAGNDTSGTNRIYVSYTRDFSTVLNATPDVLFYPGYAVIDATVAREGGSTYLFFKNEEGTGKDIQVARAPSLDLDPGSFTMGSTDYVTRGSNQATTRPTEGPFLIYQEDKSRWILYADLFGQGGVFGAWTAPTLDTNPSAWTELPATEFKFPTDVRHAHAVRVTVAELDALLAHHGDGVRSRLRTTYSDQGNPFYLAHSWYHGIITNLDDRASGLTADDFFWKIVPGLADPTDASLISFEAVGYPGRYLRIDSQNLFRYPPCNQGSSRGNALCLWDGLNVPENRHHLVWLDEHQNTATFKSDATFRRVAPLISSDSPMISLQWHTDPTHYLRHASYQVFAWPASDNKTAFSFAIEEAD